jgi:hypothetical protein
VLFGVVKADIPEDVSGASGDFGHGMPLRKLASYAVLVFRR